MTSIVPHCVERLLGTTLSGISIVVVNLTAYPVFFPTSEDTGTIVPVIAGAETTIVFDTDSTSFVPSFMMNSTVWRPGDVGSIIPFPVKLEIRRVLGETALDENERPAPYGDDVGTVRIRLDPSQIGVTMVAGNAPSAAIDVVAVPSKDHPGGNLILMLKFGETRVTPGLNAIVGLDVVPACGVVVLHVITHSVGGNIVSISITAVLL
jgi:hypothetical protein